MKYETAIVTGASSGIGDAYARELAKETKTLVLVARREDRLEALAQELSCNVEVFTCDLIDRPQRLQLISKLSKLSQISLLVNNAGFGSLGEFSNLDAQRELDMIELNCRAPLELSMGILENLKNNCKNSPLGIINVASVAAYTPMPYMATYAATKSFLHSLSLALNLELKRRNIFVMSHCPGPTPSEFHLVVGLKQKLDFLPSVSVEDVVKKALSDFERKKPVSIYGFKNQLAATVCKLAPSTFSAKVVSRSLSQVIPKPKSTNNF